MHVFSKCQKLQNNETLFDYAASFKKTKKNDDNKKPVSLCEI